MQFVCLILVANMSQFWWAVQLDLDFGDYGREEECSGDYDLRRRVAAVWNSDEDLFCFHKCCFMNLIF